MKSLLPLSLKDVVIRSDAVELMKLLHPESTSTAILKKLAQLIDDYDETVIAVQHHVSMVAQNLIKEGIVKGDINDTELQTERLLYSLLLVGASARINECLHADQQSGEVSKLPARVTFSSVNAIVFKLDGKPQAHMTVVIEAEDPLNTQSVVCMRTDATGRLPISYELAQGSYMMTVLYSDHVERQPIFIGQPKGEKPKGSVKKLV